jgi:hypothetical protein
MSAAALVTDRSRSYSTLTAHTNPNSRHYTTQNKLGGSQRYKVAEVMSLLGIRYRAPLPRPSTMPPIADFARTPASQFSTSLWVAAQRARSSCCGTRSGTQIALSTSSSTTLGRTHLGSTRSPQPDTVEGAGYRTCGAHSVAFFPIPYPCAPFTHTCSGIAVSYALAPLHSSSTFSELPPHVV